MGNNSSQIAEDEKGHRSEDKFDQPSFERNGAQDTPSTQLIPETPLPHPSETSRHAATGSHEGSKKRKRRESEKSDTGSRKKNAKSAKKKRTSATFLVTNNFAEGDALPSPPESSVLPRTANAISSQALPNGVATSEPQAFMPTPKSSDFRQLAKSSSKSKPDRKRDRPSTPRHPRVSQGQFLDLSDPVGPLETPGRNSLTPKQRKLDKERQVFAKLLEDEEEEEEQRPPEENHTLSGELASNEQETSNIEQDLNVEAVSGELKRSSGNRKTKSKQKKFKKGKDISRQDLERQDEGESNPLSEVQPILDSDPKYTLDDGQSMRQLEPPDEEESTHFPDAGTVSNPNLERVLEGRSSKLKRKRKHNSVEKSYKHKRTSNEQTQENIYAPPIESDDEVMVSPLPSRRAKPSKSAKSTKSKTPKSGKESEPPVEIISGPFSKDELSIITSIIDTYRNEKGLTQQAVNNIIQDTQGARQDPALELWLVLFESLPHRNRQAIYKVCRRRFHNYSKRGKWTPEEDQELRDAYTMTPDKWKVIGKKLERMPEDCRDRWRNYIKCGTERKSDVWSEKEEIALHEAVENCLRKVREMENQEDAPPSETLVKAVSWSVVSDKLGNTRSRLQCMVKWKKMQQMHEREVTKTSTKEKSSFRTKEAERHYAKMLPGDKYRILHAIRATESTQEKNIPWRLVAKQDSDSKWSTADRKLVLARMKKMVPSQESLDLTLKAALAYLKKEHGKELGNIYQESTKRTRISGSKSKKFKSAELVPQSDDMSQHPNDGLVEDRDEQSEDNTPTTLPETNGVGNKSEDYTDDELYAERSSSGFPSSPPEHPRLTGHGERTPDSVVGAYSEDSDDDMEDD